MRHPGVIGVYDKVLFRLHHRLIPPHSLVPARVRNHGGTGRHEKDKTHHPRSSKLDRSLITCIPEGVEAELFSQFIPSSGQSLNHQRILCS